VSILARLKVGQQIGLVGLLGILSVVAIAAVYGASSMRQAQLQEATDANAHLQRIVSSISINLLQARRAEKDFLLRQDVKYAQRMDELVPQLERHFHQANTILQKLDDTDGLTGKVAQVQEAFERYKAEFGKVVATQRELGLDEKSGLEGALRASVHEAETKLAQSDEPRLLQIMLMMRRHEKDFMLRIDPKYLQDINQRIAEFTSALALSNLPDATRRELTQQLSNYHRNFVAYVQARMRLVAEVKTLSETYAALEPILEDLEHTAAAEFEAAQTEIEKNRSDTMRTIWVTVGAALLGVIVLALVIGRAITRPLVSIAAAMQRLAQEDLDADVVGKERRDEIGTMARALQVFKDALIAKRDADAAAAAEAEAKVRRAARLDELTRDFELSAAELSQSLAAAAAEMEATAQSMSATAEQTDRLALTVSTAAEQTSGNVRSVAAASEELSYSIQEIATRVAQSSQIASDAVEDTRRMDETVRALEAGAQKIGEVVNLISAIASQTNLLALNATIEAARAGEAGRGFAVVASEVKALADQTTKATDEISVQVERIRATTADAVQAIQSVGRVIGTISEISTGIAASVEEQGSATQEITRGAQEAAQGTQHVTHSIGEVKQGASKTGEAAQSVLVAARGLAEQSNELGRRVEAFLVEVKAA